MELQVLGVFWDPSRGFRGWIILRKILGSKEPLDWLKIDFNVLKGITVQDYNKQLIRWKYTYRVFKLRVKQVIYESNIEWQHTKAKAARYSASNLKNLCIFPENPVKWLRFRREGCWNYLVSFFEITPKNLVVQERMQL